MGCASVSRHQYPNEGIPIIGILIDKTSDHFIQSTIKFLNDAIRTRPVGSSSGLSNFNQFTNLREQRTVKILPLTRIDFQGGVKSRDEFVNQFFCDGLSLLVWKWVRFYPSREVIAYVLLLFIFFGKGSIMSMPTLSMGLPTKYFCKTALGFLFRDLNLLQTAQPII